MAKKASSTKKDGKKKAEGKAKPAKKALANRPAKSKSSGGNAGSDTVRKLIESPLVADLLAVGATAALAAIAQHGFGSGEGKGGTSKALKQAGKAAASAMGQKLSSEFKEIRKAAENSKAGAKA